MLSITQLSNEDLLCHLLEKIREENSIIIYVSTEHITQIMEKETIKRGYVSCIHIKEKEDNRMRLHTKIIIFLQKINDGW